jgi:soluble lytic murein transglycosylase-like protein
MRLAPEQLQPIIDAKAEEFGIESSLVEAFCMTESTFNIRATRYEANFYKNYIQPMLAHNAIDPKEALGRATSWGLMQIMGQVAREKGFKGEFEELFDPEIGLKYSLRHLRNFIEHYEPNLDDAIASYNAGSPRKGKDGKYVNQSYVDRIHKYQNQIMEV